VDDAVEAVVRLLHSPPVPGRAAPYRVLNIGNRRPVGLLRVIALLEQHLGRRAELSLLPMQPGDVGSTHADVTALLEATGFAPATTIEEGIARFAEWFLAWRASRSAGDPTAQAARERNPCA
jgi:UDP-glucuronate 4-epimerase